LHYFNLTKCIWFYQLLYAVNTLASARIQGFSEKNNTETHVALQGNFSGPVSSTDPVKVSKDAASLLVCTRKKLFCLGGCGFFVSDVISEGLLGHFAWPWAPTVRR